MTAERASDRTDTERLDWLADRVREGWLPSTAHDGENFGYCIRTP
jgi:hypothetical protein